MNVIKAPLRAARNAYYRVFPRLRYPFTGQKQILLYVNNHAMASHIRRYAEPLLRCPDYRFFLYYPDLPAASDPKNDFLTFLQQSPIQVIDRPQRHAWDLIVCADLRTPASFTAAMTPILYVNHGLHIISMNGGEDLYCYGDYAVDEKGAPRFTKMLESNAGIAEKMAQYRPAFRDVIVHTGFKFASGIEEAVANRASSRRALGVTDETTLVGFFGTWREYSLFHQLGSGLFDACEAMRGRGYQFLFSIHPKEYERYDDAIEPLGPLVEAQRARGMLVRSPQEDFLPYLAACDVVVSDYSSMAESALLAGRKLIFSPYPDGMVWKYSLTARARESLPTLRSPAELEPLLEKARREALNPFIPRACAELVNPRHDEIVENVTRELLRLAPREARHA